MKSFPLTLLWLLIYLYSYNKGKLVQTVPATDSVYVAKDGYVVVEAEDLPYSPKWIFQTAKDNFTGRGYLKWTGGTQGSGEEQEQDRTGALQGNPQNWLVIPVQIEKTGIYRVDLRNRHNHKDGDNDVWVHIKDWPLPVRRMGDHAEETFQWLTWGTDWVTFNITKKGVYQFYIAGRSNNFGIDRIAIYHEDAPTKIKLRAFPVSKKTVL